MAPKKAAKKAPARHGTHKAREDARRTFEHLGRIQVLAPLALAERETITLLVSTADRAFSREHEKESADLLRAAEHLSFACLVDSPRADQISDELVAAIREKFNHLMEHIEERGARDDAPPRIRAISERMAKQAESAMKEGSFRQALELARGAEALAHIHHLDENMIGTGDTRKRLEGRR